MSDKYRRKALDEIIRSATNAGEGADGILRRLLGDHFDPSLLDPAEYQRMTDDVRDMTGHMALAKSKGLDPSKYGDMTKLMTQNYPALENVNKIIDPSDPDFKRKAKGLLEAGDAGAMHSSQFKKGGNFIPTAIAVSPDVPNLHKASNMLHEGRHAIDSSLGYDSKIMKDYKPEMVIGSKGNADFMDKVSKGHHDTKRMYEAEKITSMFDDIPDVNAKKMKSASRAIKAGSKGLGKIMRSIPLVGPLAAAVAAGSMGDAMAAVPILGDSESLGGGEDAKAYEDPSSAEFKARMEAIKKMKSVK